MKGRMLLGTVVLCIAWGELIGAVSGAAFAACFSLGGPSVAAIVELSRVGATIGLVFAMPFTVVGTVLVTVTAATAPDAARYRGKLEQIWAILLSLLCVPALLLLPITLVPLGVAGALLFFGTPLFVTIYERWAAPATPTRWCRAAST